jgi:ABC-2 type transport system permease protein
VFRSASLAFLRLDLAEARRSRWLAFTVAVYAALLAAFVAFGLRESTVLGFTGMSRAILNVSNAVLVAVPLVCLVGTVQAVVRGRSSGAFELLLSLPCRRSQWFAGLVASRLLVLVGPLVVLLGLAGIVGGISGPEPSLGATVGRCLAVSTALAWAFTGIGILLSSFARSPERALVHALVVWIGAVALHDFALIGVLLRWNVPSSVVFALAAVNPVEGARLGVLSGIDPDLAVLGPVGFWLATHLGAAKTLLLAVAWPATIGGIALACARVRFDRSDVVG